MVYDRLLNIIFTKENKKKVKTITKLLKSILNEATFTSATTTSQQNMITVRRKQPMKQTLYSNLNIRRIYHKTIGWKTTSVLAF